MRWCDGSRWKTAAGLTILGYLGPYYLVNLKRNCFKCKYLLSRFQAIVGTTYQNPYVTLNFYTASFCKEILKAGLWCSWNLFYFIRNGCNTSQNFKLHAKCHRAFIRPQTRVLTSYTNARKYIAIVRQILLNSVPCMKVSVDTLKMTKKNSYYIDQMR